VRTPLEPTESERLSESLSVVSVMRGGNLMAEAVMDMIPSSTLRHVGIYRDSATLAAVEYYNKLPANMEGERCIVCDITCATAGTAVAAIEMLKERGATNITFMAVLACPEGLRYMMQRHPDVDIFVAGIDRTLSAGGEILPGLGDAGDRLYNTHSGDGESPADSVRYLLALKSVRISCSQILALGRAGSLPSFVVNMDAMSSLEDRVRASMDRAYPGGLATVPSHSRWRQLEQPGGADRVTELSASWGQAVHAKEAARRKIDLIVCSVLLDCADTGGWAFTEEGGAAAVGGAAGTALAHLAAFKAGAFSSVAAVPHMADADGLCAFSEKTLADAFQTGAANELPAAPARVSAITNLGKRVNENSKFFSAPTVAAREEFGGNRLRIGNLVDYLLTRCSTDSAGKYRLGDLWAIVQNGILAESDADYCKAPTIATGAESTITFHATAQWLVLSLLEPLAEVGIKFSGEEELTALADPQNGGLLVDSGVLTPRDATAYVIPPVIPAAIPVVGWSRC